MRDRINLYTQYLDMNKEERPFPFLAFSITLLFTSLLILGVSFTIVKMENNRLVKRQEIAESYVSSENNLRQYTSALENKESIELRNELLTKIDSVNAVLDEKNQFNPDILEQITSALPYGVSVSNFDFNNGIASVNYESTSIEGPSLFARNLSRNPFIKTLNYQGFVKTEKSVESEEEASIIDFDEIPIIKKEVQVDIVYTGTLELIFEGGY